MPVASTERCKCASFRPLAAAFVCAVASSEESVKLSGSLAQPVGGNVSRSLAAPDGSRVVYVADQELDERYELYVVLNDGSQAPVKLSNPSHGNVHFDAPRITPDGNTVVYLTDEPALFRVQIDGSAAPLELAGDIAVQDAAQFRFEISADGQWVVYREDDPARLLAVPMDGSQPPIALGPPPGAATVAEDFGLCADSSRVAFRAGAADPGFELFSVPIDGSAAPVRLNVPFTEPRQTVASFRISPDGQRVVHVVHDVEVDSYGEETFEAYQLFSAGIDGAAEPVELGQVLPDQVSVGTLTITLDSARVLYLADTLVDDRFELFSIPLDGGADPVRLNGEHASSEPWGIRSPRLTADGRRVVYQTSGRELFSAPIAQAGREVKLSQDDAWVESFELVSSGARVVYKARLPGREEYDLFSVASARGLPRIFLRSQRRIVRLAQDVYDYVLHPDGTTVLYRTGVSSGLFRVDVTGGAALELVAGPGYVIYRAASGERVLYSHYPGPQSPAWELFSAPFAGGPSVRLNLAPLDASASLLLNPLPPAGPFGIPTAFRISPDSARVVYVADQEVDGRSELFTVPTDGSQELVKLSAPLPPGGSVSWDFRVSPDGSRVVFFADADTVDLHELYSVPIGGGEPLRLNDPIPPGGGFELTFPATAALEIAGGRVAYALDQEVAGRVELYVARLDGRLSAVKVNGPLAGDTNDALPFAFAGPDRLVYLAPQELAGIPELFARSLLRVPFHRRR